MLGEGGESGWARRVGTGVEQSGGGKATTARGGLRGGVISPSSLRQLRILAEPFFLGMGARVGGGRYAMAPGCTPDTIDIMAASSFAFRQGEDEGTHEDAEGEVQVQGPLQR